MAQDPDMLVPLTSARTEFEASTIAEALKSNGIAARVFAASANMLQAEVLSTDPIRVMVRRQDLRRAADVLRAVRAESVDIDWDEVDVGNPEPGSVLPPPGPVRRIGGWSPGMHTLRRVGWMLMTIAFVFAWFRPTRLPAMAAAIVLAVLLSWGMIGGKPRRGARGFTGKAPRP